MIGRREVKAVPSGEIWRHEDKYLIDEVNFFHLYWKLRPFLEVDANAVVPDDSMLPPENQFPGYQVRSLYFDTPERHALFEKLAGFDHRAKYRIRIYNGTDTVITLEKKIKRNSYCRKEKAGLTRAQTEALIAGEYEWLPQIGPLGEELYAEMRTRLLSPLVLVDYHRIPLIWPADEIRITFDRHLSTGLFRTDIFEETAPVHPVLAPGQVILEVKYNHFLPDFLRCLLAGPRNASLAVSKYAMCSRDITMSGWGDPQDFWQQDWTYPDREK